MFGLNIAYILYLIISYFILYICAFKIYYTYKNDEIIGNNKTVEKKLFKFPIIVWFLFAFIITIPILGLTIFLTFLYLYYNCSNLDGDYPDEFNIVIKNKLFKKF